MERFINASVGAFHQWKKKHGMSVTQTAIKEEEVFFKVVDTNRF